eukprot:621665-Amphidinium_carterae.1
MHLICNNYCWHCNWPSLSFSLTSVHIDFFDCAMQGGFKFESMRQPVNRGFSTLQASSIHITYQPSLQTCPTDSTHPDP